MTDATLEGYGGHVEFSDLACCTDPAAKAVPAQRRLTWALVDEHGGLLRHAPEDRGAE